MTLAEVLLSSFLGLLVILAVSKVDVTRVSATQDVRAATRFQSGASRVISHMQAHLERADRVYRIENGQSAPYRTNVLIRIPELDTDRGACICTAGPVPTCCYDIPENFRWVHYRFDPPEGTVRFFEDAFDCSTGGILARRIDRLHVLFVDRGPTPPGGEPFGNPADTNALFLWVRGRSTVTGEQLEESGEANLRAVGNTNVNADASGPVDTGDGLAPDDPAFDPPSPECA